MQNTVSKLLAEKGIFLAAPISLSDCTVTRPYLLERAGIQTGTAFLFAVPYYTTKCDDPARNISVYAVSRDYHLFFSRLFDEILPLLREQFPQHRFVGFTDHSPISEGDAAVGAGLGFWGCNHLFLTREHSSFVFLGEIITDAIIPTKKKAYAVCENCGACRRACPVALDVSLCHSALTQKKGALDEAEIATLKKEGMAWGCDVCQMCCPHTVAAKRNGTLYTTIPFFSENAIAHLSAQTVQDMTDEEFSKRAYSWRGKNVILRNLTYLEEGEGHD